LRRGMVLLRKQTTLYWRKTGGIGRFPAFFGQISTGSLPCTLERARNEHQRCANKPVQGNALGKPSLKDKALKGRDNLCRPFRALSFFNATPRAALVPRLPWAGLFAGLWPSAFPTAKVHDRL
jgi:hypothetical protein